MDVDSLKLVHLRQPQQCLQVRLMRVDAAVAKQATDMQLRLVAFHMLNCLEQGRIVEEGAIADRLANARVILQHALTGSDILVTNLRVAHLPLWQTHRFARGLDSRVGPLASQSIQIRGASQRYGVSLFAWVDAPAIHNDQNKGARSPRRCCTHASYNSNSHNAVETTAVIVSWTYSNFHTLFRRSLLSYQIRTLHVIARDIRPPL